MKTKKEIRQEVRRRRSLLTLEEELRFSNEITQQILAMPEYEQTDCVYCYVDYNHEVMTGPLIRQALADGKRVAVPRVNGKEMDFYYITGEADLEPGYYGIREPKQGLPAAKEGDALFLMPGVGFDAAHHRVGYGGGFYDRYLEKWPNLKPVALAYDCQLFDEVPAEKFDIRPRIIVTESRVSHLDPTVTELGMRAKRAAFLLGSLTTDQKNRALLTAADLLEQKTDVVLKANELDMEHGRAKGMHQGLLDRLRLDAGRVKAMAEGLRQVASLPDPVGEILNEFKRPNGLVIRQKRVPFGVIGMIYESRPNVTADAFGLCFKAGNAVILKGGSDALHSNQAIAGILREALVREMLPCDALLLITSTDREDTKKLMQMKRYVDVLIPRGGAGLIRSVVENSTVPVIETGTGNCHIFVDESADPDMAADIIFNAKTQRIGVCNACESLLIHKNAVDRILPFIAMRLKEKEVEIRGDETVCSLLPDAKHAEEEDWGKEYLDYIISAKTVSGVEEAIAHINRYNTRHSEAIITNDPENAEKFLNGVDAAAVYVNASTRFTDGFEFGFGAEIGISTQKLHARGPMGLTALTTYKYQICGNGQVRT